MMSLIAPADVAVKVSVAEPAGSGGVSQSEEYVPLNDPVHGAVELLI